jgi:aminopeptidase-like protein
VYTKKFYNFASNNLFKINRSITGKGTFETLLNIKKKFPQLKIKKVKSGSKVFDWKVPQEWNVSEAYIIDKNGKKIIDFKKNNLHLVGYSIPIDKYVLKKEILEHLHTLPNQKNAIPYVTSYYKKYWGFCIRFNEYLNFLKNYSQKDKFRVVIKSNFKSNGNLVYGEFFVKGETNKEILISTYICHPSMANNELSGPIVSMSLINFFKKKRLKYSIRFIFIPETIGSIVFLKRNLKKLKKNLLGGYNLTCLGYSKNYGCILSKYKDNLCDKYLLQAYKKLNINYKQFSFLDRGSDERQFNSPKVDFPIATVFRSKFGNFKQYHTSLDNFDIVTNEIIESSFKLMMKTIEIFQKQIIPIAAHHCEPNMGKRGLYSLISEKNTKKKFNNTKNLMNFLQYSDGKNDINDIAKIIKLTPKEVMKNYTLLKTKKLFEI